MSTLRVLLLAAIIPIAIFAYTCHYDDGVSTPTDCSATTYCTTVSVSDQNNNVVKTVKGCDTLGLCSSNMCYDTPKAADGFTSKICCCTGDYCNSATSSSVFAIPAMICAYFLLK